MPIKDDTISELKFERFMEMAKKNCEKFKTSIAPGMFELTRIINFKTVPSFYLGILNYPGHYPMADINSMKR